MFTVKHYRKDGSIDVGSCHRYVVATGKPARIELYAKGAAKVIVPEMGETVFVENLAGKTVTTVRPDV